ncbi:MAG: GDP-mannose 4,6-dehydratase [Acidimicrobiia bacterium]|nr:GDP-mannose 4,6-dehydratase [Acidimicrobiia bacterium]
MPTALVTGVTGQDGSYLAEFLLAKGYEVHGTTRRTSLDNTGRLRGVLADPAAAGRFCLHTADMTDGASLVRLLEATRPDEIYNLAAQSHVAVSFEVPEQTMQTTGLGPLRLLEALRSVGGSARFYQASSSEMFGSAPVPQNEHSPLRPRSPYGCAKALGHCLVGSYRESYGLFAVSGILFNHESPRRGETFVTRKITRGVAEILAGRTGELRLGNLDARRDWGFAGDYVEAMWLMLQQDEPEDYVVGTGVAHSVREFCELAFGQAGLRWGDHVVSDPQFVRPAELDHLVADPTKAQRDLSWKPKVDFEGLVSMMLEADRSALGVSVV